MVSGGMNQGGFSLSLLTIAAAFLAFSAALPIFAQAQPGRDERRGELGATVQGGVLRVGAGCSEAHPCNVRFGNTVHTVKTAASVKVSGAESGLVFVYVNASGDLTAGSKINLQCEGCSYERGVTQFPATSIPLFTWTVLKRPANSTEIMDYRADLSSKNIKSGPGIMTTENEGTTTIALDPTLVSLHAATPPRTSTSSCSTGEFSFDGDYYYVCVATNKWKRAALSSF